MYNKEYKKRGIYFKMLLRVLEDSGILIFLLVLWNICGVYIIVILGVFVLIYGLYVLLNIINLIVFLVLIVCKFKIVRIEDEFEICLNFDVWYFNCLYKFFIEKDFF